MFSKHIIPAKNANRLLKILFLLITFYTVVVFLIAVFNWQAMSRENFDFSLVDFSVLREPAFICENFLDGSLENYNNDSNQPDCKYNIPLAVVIDNEISAPLPVGLEKAKLVFEALAEGGITRYLAFFDSGDEIETIGQVRSLRPYLADWAEGQRALLAHAGGSPLALSQLATADGLIDIDEISADGLYFFRDKKKSAPHNLYTSTLLLKNGLAVKYNFLKETPLWQNSALEEYYQKNKWSYQNTDNLSRQSISLNRLVKPIVIDFSTFGYKVKYEYNSEENNYWRYLADKIYLTEKGENIKVKNVIVIWLKTYLIDNLRLAMDTLGKGQALVCRDGECLPSVWRKDKPEQRIQFFNFQDQPISLSRGTTWIEVVPEGREVDY